MVNKKISIIGILALVLIGTFLFTQNLIFFGNIRYYDDNNALNGIPFDSYSTTEIELTGLSGELPNYVSERDLVKTKDEETACGASDGSAVGFFPNFYNVFQTRQYFVNVPSGLNVKGMALEFDYQPSKTWNVNYPNGAPDVTYRPPGEGISPTDIKEKFETSEVIFAFTNQCPNIISGKYDGDEEFYYPNSCDAKDTFTSSIREAIRCYENAEGTVGLRSELSVDETGTARIFIDELPPGQNIITLLRTTEFGQINLYNPKLVIYHSGGEIVAGGEPSTEEEESGLFGLTGLFGIGSTSPQVKSQANTFSWILIAFVVLVVAIITLGIIRRRRK